MSIYRTEKDLIIEQLWKIVFRVIGEIDDAGCDWFTVGNRTYIADLSWEVSDVPEVARIVNAINALEGYPEFAYRSRKEAEGNERSEAMEEQEGE